MRLLAWNCHHGALDRTLSDAAALSADIAFLQEWRPDRSTAPPANAVTRLVGPRKGVAIASLSPHFQVQPLALKRGCARGVVAATVTGPMSFTVIGIWGQGPNYGAHVLRSIRSCASLLGSGPAVVMGDLNSGTKLGAARRLTKGHPPIVQALSTLGLVSAYHAFHGVEHGHETHATYRHQFKASQPWHLDFCFIPNTWAPHVRSVDVVHDDEWAKRSDHGAVVVELDICKSQVASRKWQVASGKSQVASRKW